MTETYYAGSYWLARQESAEACARRAELFFRLLGRCDPTWTHWHDTADSEEAKASQVNPDAATFTRMFGREKNRQGEDGFRFWLWGGDTVEEATSVNTRCGAATPWLSSTCVLDLPTRGPVATRVLTAPVMTEVLRAMALAWEPEWGVVTSHEHRNRVSERAKAGTFVGWMMYFSHLRGTVPPLPPPVRVEPVEDKGTLVILTHELFTVSNPGHVALAARVQEALTGARLLRPLQPFVTGA
jgi:hypothetical protein